MRYDWESAYNVGKRESSLIVGKDPEDVFLREIIKRSGKNKLLLDIGTGDGETPNNLSNRFKFIFGVDISRKLIGIASKGKKRNVEFKVADGRKLPFEKDKFNVVTSQRGPVSSNKKFAKEAYRVLKKGGYLIEITIGEKDKENLKKIFRRGQNYDLIIEKKKSITLKSKLLKSAGFKIIKIREYDSKEYFKTLDDLILRLKSTPIITDFNENKDKNHLKKVMNKFWTRYGILTNSHRLIIVAKK